MKLQHLLIPDQICQNYYLFSSSPLHWTVNVTPASGTKFQPSIPPIARDFFFSIFNSRKRANAKGPQSDPFSPQRILKNYYFFIRHYLPCILWGPQLRVRALCEVRAGQRVLGVPVLCLGTFFSHASSHCLLQIPTYLWLVTVNTSNPCLDSAALNRGQHGKKNRGKEVCQALLCHQPLPCSFCFSGINIPELNWVDLGLATFRAGYI